MAGKSTPSSVRLLIGLRSDEPQLLDELTGRLSLELGEVADRSERWVTPWAQVAAWGQVAGDSDWHRQWLALAEPVDPAHLTRLKQHALRVEQLFLSPHGRKRLLLDVAYIDHARVIRASENDALHRIYLGSGLFGEILFHWRGSDACDPLPWTPPTEQVPPARAFFDRVHAVLMKQLDRERRDTALEKGGDRA